MAMSDCEKCWSTPCVCGHDYKNWGVKQLEDQIKMLSEVLECKTPNPTKDQKYWSEMREELDMTKEIQITKDRFAQEKGYENWNKMYNLIILGRYETKMNNYITEVMKLLYKNLKYEL